MGLFTSPSMYYVRKALGLPGQGALDTEWLDGELVQNMNIADLIRRGGTPGITGGIFYAHMQNAHAAANSQESVINPYGVSPTLKGPAPWPCPVDEKYDIWVLSFCAIRSAGPGSITTGGLFVDYDDSSLAFSIDQAGAAPGAGSGRICLGYYTAEAAIGGLNTVLLPPDGRAYSDPRFRLPRVVTGNGTRLRFATTSDAAATFQCQILLGLFPVGLGQDVQE